MKNQSSFYIDNISHSPLFKHNQQGAKLIQEMQTEAPYRTHLSYLDQSDQEALNLFDNLNPNQDDIVSNHPQEEEPEQDDSIPHLGRLSKMNHQSKKDKNKLKKKEKRRKMMQRMKMLQNQGSLAIVTPQKNKRKQKRIKERLGSDSDAKLDENINSSDMGSDSENKQDLMNELRFLNPDAAEEQPSTAKRLKKSNRKIRLEQKQGFKLDELGNDPQVNNDELQKSYEDQDYSFEDIDKKKKQKRKLKVKAMSNEQILNNLKQHEGIVEEDCEQNINKPYDNGLDTLYAMKGKKKGGIKINNRMFCDLQIDERDAEAHVNPPENLQLQIKPKIVNPPSARFNFLSKAETLKKQRGLEANIDLEDYQRKQQQRVKSSVAQIVNTLKNTQFQAEIQVQIKIPTISRGKSADIINNTVFLKTFSSKSDPVQTPSKIQIIQNNFNLKKKEIYSRKQFYQQIHEQNRLRRSKFISEQHLKESFKKTNLQQLQQARKRIQQKKRKQALSEQQSQSESQQLDSQAHKMQELLQQQERICGDINEEPQNAEADDDQEQNDHQNIEKGLKQVAFTVNVEGQENVDIDEKVMKQSQQNLQAQKENNSQYGNEQNEIIDELASASSHFEEREVVDQQPENEDEQSNQSVQQQHPNAEEPIPNEQENNGQLLEMNQQDKRKKMELEEEGIMIRKRKIDHSKINKMFFDKIIEQTPQKIVVQKQNQINLTNKLDQQDKSYSKHLAELKKDDFTGFKKLRNFARVMAEKRRKYEEGKKYAAQFIQQEAQQGSDNQDHDDIVKKINYEDQNKQYEGIDLDADLAELIDNAVDLNEQDEFQAFRKYLEDIKIKDREQIKQIIRGEFRSKHEDIQFQIDEDDKKRQERMEEVMNWMKKRQEDQGQNIYLKKAQNQDDDENSDSELSYKQKKKQLQVQSDHIPEQQEQAMIQKFLEDTLPSTKKESRPLRHLDLGPLPQSVRLEKSISKTISLTRMGSKHSSDSGTSKLKRTSSLVNEILNKNNTFKFAQKKMPTKAVK